MKKTVYALLLCLVLTFVSCTNGVPSPSPQESTPASPSPDASSSPTPKLPSITDYFPFEENVHMVYVGEGNEFAEYETYVEYLNDGSIQIRSINPGTDSVSVYVLEDGALKRVLFRGETYYRLNQLDIRETEEVVMQEPIAVGTYWTLEDGSARSITSLDAKVEVPFGSFTALEITTTREMDTVKSYYVKGIGLVKSEFVAKEDPDSVISSSLKTVEKEKPYGQLLRFYYPDFNNDRLVYLEKDIELYTNDDIKDFFQENMKNVPEGSELTPLMSENTYILGITFDEKEKIVTVDFSPEFISEMNAGSSLESMILMSVANTFGHYFQTEKVNITINGNNYESGHISLKSEEYLTADFEGSPLPE